MASQTTFFLHCACGHAGCLIKTRGNPERKDRDELYSLTSLDGRSYCVRHSVSLDEVFKHVKPACPSCGAALGMDAIRESSRLD